PPPNYLLAARYTIDIQCSRTRHRTREEAGAAQPGNLSWRKRDHAARNLAGDFSGVAGTAIVRRPGGAVDVVGDGSHGIHGSDGCDAWECGCRARPAATAAALSADRSGNPGRDV